MGSKRGAGGETTLVIIASVTTLLAACARASAAFSSRGRHGGEPTSSSLSRVSAIYMKRNKDQLSCSTGRAGARTRARFIKTKIRRRSFYCAFYGPLTLCVIGRDVGVGPFSAENTADSLAPAHRYFGLQSEGDSDRDREEERVRSAVISLVKAGLLCEFLISVHLPVIPSRLHDDAAHTAHAVTCTYTHIHVYTYTRVRTPDDGGWTDRGREEERRTERGLFSSWGKPSPVEG